MKSNTRKNFRVYSIYQEPIKHSYLTGCLTFLIYVGLIISTILYIVFQLV
jgi:hypothetical protein